MAGPGCRRLLLACVTLALTANCAAVTAAAQRLTTITPATTAADTERAPRSSRVAAVLAPCLVFLAVAATLGLALAAAKLRERRQTEGGFGPRQLEAPGGRTPPAEPGSTSISTLAARVERLV